MSLSPTLQQEIIDTYPIVLLIRMEEGDYVLDFGARGDLTEEEGLHTAFMLIVKAMREHGMIVPDPPHPSESAGYL